MSLSPTSSRGSSSGGSAGLTELNYVERTTAQSGAGTLVTSGSVTVVSGKTILVEYFCPHLVVNGNTSSATCQLQIDGVTTGQLGIMYAGGVTDLRVIFWAQRELSGLSAGAHTFATVAGGAGGTWFAGDGTTTNDVPMFLRISQVN